MPRNTRCRAHGARQELHFHFEWRRSLYCLQGIFPFPCVRRDIAESRASPQGKP